MSKISILKHTGSQWKEAKTVIMWCGWLEAELLRSGLVGRREREIYRWCRRGVRCNSKVWIVWSYGMDYCRTTLDGQIVCIHPVLLAFNCRVHVEKKRWDAALSDSDTGFTSFNLLQHSPDHITSFFLFYVSDWWLIFFLILLAEPPLEAPGQRWLKKNLSSIILMSRTKKTSGSTHTNLVYICQKAWITFFPFVFIKDQ